MGTEILYYEVHVTILPIEDEKLREKLSYEAMFLHRFRMAALLMEKGKPAPDCFFTLRANSRNEAISKTAKFIHWLRQQRLDVTRYKIEATLIDSRTEDTLLCLL